MDEKDHKDTAHDELKRKIHCSKNSKPEPLPYWYSKYNDDKPLEK